MKNKRNYLKENGITLIALVVTIVVLLILAGVSINALFGNSGIIEKARDAQNRMNNAQASDLNALNDLDKLIDNQANGTTGGDDNSPTIPKVSALVGTVVDKNTKAEDAYGNKITIPKGFKILPHGTENDSADYTYSGDNIPAVQDGIVIEDTQTETLGNQFVWVPVGTIKNKDNTTNTITLGRYEFDSTTGALVSTTPVQSARDYKDITSIKDSDEYFTEWGYTESCYFYEGNLQDDNQAANNADARNLVEFISTTLLNGGYYIARFEAGISGDKANSELETKTATDGTVKPQSKMGLGVWNDIIQLNAAKVAREMYGDGTDYASDLVNSYAWDTAIIFIQTYSTETDASSYASKNKSTSFANTGRNNDKYCNIWDMSGNVSEFTTESSSYRGEFHENYPGVRRGGYYSTNNSKTANYTSWRYYVSISGKFEIIGFRPIIYVK